MTVKKPIVVYIHGSEPLIGVGRRFKELHKRLLNEFDVTLLSLGNPFVAKKEYFDDGILVRCCFPIFGKLISSQSSKGYYQYRLLHYILSPFMIRKFLNKANIIHEEMSPLPFFSPLYVKKPVVLTVNEMRGVLNFRCFGIMGGVPYTLEKFLKCVPYDSVIGVSYFTHRRLNDMGVRNILIPNGVDVNKFTPLARRSSKPYLSVLTVSRLIEHKGIYDFLKVAEKVCKIRNDVKFFIVGKGPLESKLDLYIKKVGLYNRIIVLKNLSDDEYVKVIQNCDIYLHTNPNQEGFGLSVAEAMSCAKPVIAYDIPGVNDLVNPNCGVLIRPHDIDSMVKILLEFLSDKEKCNEYGTAARELVVKKYDWNISARILRKLYFYLIRGSVNN